MSETFADAFYYIALLNPGDAAHQLVLDVTTTRSGRLITTEWILTEVGDAFSAPPHGHRVSNLLKALDDDQDTVVIPSTSLLFRAGL